MKVGIVTLYGFFNHGNRLQNYALQEVLRDLGNDVETIVIKKKENIIKKYAYKIIEKSEGKYKLIHFNDIMREKNIRKFSNKNIKIKIYKQKSLYDKHSINLDFDKFVVGSDQVWNPLFWNEDISCIEFNEFLLRFADDEKKFSYAASFGISELPIWWNDKMMTELEKFSSISVREDAGVNIIKKNLNKEVTVVLDPTLLLSEKQWIKKLDLAEKKENYIFSFFLGNKAKETEEYIKLLEKDNKIIDLMNKSNRKYYCSNPRDFVNYIKNAKAVITDSFHATVFSIIFKTPFIVFGRNNKNKMNNMNSRIETLLKMFNLQDRMYNNNDIDLEVCDFGESDKIIAKEREKSIKYLKDALNK